MNVLRDKIDALMRDLETKKGMLLKQKIEIDDQIREIEFLLYDCHELLFDISIWDKNADRILKLINGEENK